MKYFSVFFLSIISINFFGQSNQNTDVYLSDISIESDMVIISNILNISNNKGYDSQPSFLDKNTMVFSSTNGDQIDILKYNIKKKEKTWVSSTVDNEHSPIVSPIKNAVSSVRILKNGKQHLYSYSLKDGSSTVLIDNLQIGYHAWYDKETVVLSIEDGTTLSLNVANIKSNTNKTVAKNVGRSLANIPKSKLISYISKETEQWEIRSYDPITDTSKKIINTLEGSEDLCWTPNGVILMAKDNELHKFDPKKDSTWTMLGALSDPRLKHITRLSVNNDTSKLALVVENEDEE